MYENTLLFKIYQCPIICLQCSLYIHLSIHEYFSTFHTWTVGNDAAISVDLEIENSISGNGDGETKEMTQQSRALYAIIGTRVQIPVPT